MLTRILIFIFQVLIAVPLLGGPILLFILFVPSAFEDGSYFGGSLLAICLIVLFALIFSNMFGDRLKRLFK
jgi:hypothetical protein